MDITCTYWWGNYKLIIGESDNEKVKLFYGAGQGEKEVLLKGKTLPRLIPVGEWGYFQLSPTYDPLSWGSISEKV
jgi:hypothetical protein